MKLRSVVIVVLAVLAAGLSCNRDPKVRSQKYVEVGNKYFNKNKLKEASIMYRKAVSVDRMNPDAYYRLGLTELSSGQLSFAAREFRRTLDLEPKKATGVAAPSPIFNDARINLSNLYLMSYLTADPKPKDLRTALEEQIDAFQKADPNSFQALRLGGYLMLADGKLKEALAKFQAADKAKPLQPDVVLALAESLALEDRFPEAEKLAHALIQKEKGYLQIYAFLYQQYMARKRLEEAEAILKTETNNNPKNVQAIAQLAWHYFSQKKRPEMLSTLDRLLSNPKDFPNARLDVGDFYARIREWNEATHQFQEGIRTNSKLKGTYQKRLAILLVEQGRKQEAARYLVDILKTNPKDFEAQAMHASLLLDTGGTKDLATAISELQSLIPRTSDNPNPVLRFELGRAYWMKGEYSQAEVQLKEAVKIKPDYLPPRLLLAQLALFKQPDPDFATANQIANEVLRFSPRNVSAKLIRARALAGLRRFEEARADLLEAQKIDPNSSDVLFQVGVLQIIERKFKESEDTFRKLYQSSDYRGLAGLTEAYAAQNQFDHAIQLLQTELVKAPGNLTIRNYLANIAVRAEKYDLAITQFKSLAADDPKREDLFLRLGEAYRRNSDLKNAAEAFRKAAELAPNDAVPHLQVALLLEVLGQREAARAAYERTLKLQPDNAVALNNLAYIMAEMGGDLDQALTLAQRAKQRLPRDPNVGDTLGWIYIKKNLTDSAVDVFRNLVSEQPKNATYRYHFGMALLQKGDKLGAKKELQTALQSNPSKAEEGKIRELIAKIG